MRRKIAFFGLRAEILLARSQGLLDYRAGPFLGSVKKYWFFGEIFTSDQKEAFAPDVVNAQDVYKHIQSYTFDEVKAIDFLFKQCCLPHFRRVSCKAIKNLQVPQLPFNLPLVSVLQNIWIS